MIALSTRPAAKKKPRKLGMPLVESEPIVGGTLTKLILRVLSGFFEKSDVVHSAAYGLTRFGLYPERFFECSRILIDAV